MRKAQRSFLCIVVLVIAIGQVAAQRSKADSLEGLLAKEKVDTNRVKLLNQLSKIYNAASDYKRGLAYAKEALTISELEGRQRDIANSLTNVGVAFRNQGMADTAITLFNRALEIRKEHGSKKEIFSSENNLGNSYVAKGELAKGLEHFLNSLRICEELKDTFSMSVNVQLIGVVYKDMRDYPKATEYNLRALGLAEGVKDSIGIAYALNSLGNTYSAQKDFDQAIVYLQRSLKVGELIGNKMCIKTALNNLGLNYSNKGDFAKAMQYYFSALKENEAIGDSAAIAAGCINIGELSSVMGNNEVGLKYLLKGKDISERIGDRKNLFSACSMLSDLYSRTGNFEKALLYEKRKGQLRDSLLGDERMKQIAEMSAKYETEKKESEIKLLSAEKDLQQARAGQLEMEKTSLRNRIVFGTAVLLLLGGGFFVYIRIRRKNERAQMEKQVLELEQKALRLQMNPHFIFNALSSINNFIGDNQTAEARRYLSKFAKLMRLVLENSRETFVLLQNEVELLRSYMEIEQLRFTGKFDFEIVVDPAIDPEAIRIPPMLIQPHIENAILHGFAPAEKKGMLWLRFNVNGKSIRCEVEDNGVGRKASIQKERPGHKSTAMKVSQERLALLSKDGEASAINVVDLVGPDQNPAGTKIIFDLPVQVA